MAVNSIKLKRSGRQESYVPVTLVLVLFSYGCAIFSGLSESEVKVVETPPPSVYKPTEPVASDPPTPVKNDEPSRPVSSIKKPLSKQEIRQIQARLKAAGFDPGPIDGVLGPKTRSVLLRVQAGCTIVNDLVATSTTDPVAPAAETPPESTGPGNTLRKAEIELLQTRLKAAGYDPGPIDGILGARTRLALSRCKSGCTALSDLVGSSDKRAFGQAIEIQSPPAKPTASINTLSSKREIRLAQERLKAAGFDPGPIDGMLGLQTRSALEKHRFSQKVRRPGIEASADY